jgi:AraC-like DNA-binding protein
LLNNFAAIFNSSVSFNMYSSSEYLDTILTFARCGNNAREAVRLYREQFPQRQSHPDHKTILKLIARSRKTGQMQPVRRNVRTVEHEEAVLNVFEEDGTWCIRTVSREIGLSKSSVQRVLADNTTIYEYNILCQRIIQLGENFVYG